MNTTLYRREIEEAAVKHSLDPNVVEAIVMTESSGYADAFRFEPGFWKRYLAKNPTYAGENPRRVSSSYGLMQIMLPVARELGFSGEPELLFLPAVNLDWGCKKFAQLLQWANDDLAKALEAYNGGKGSVGSEATTRYASKVLRRLWEVTAIRKAV